MEPPTVYFYLDMLHKRAASLKTERIQAQAREAGPAGEPPESSMRSEPEEPDRDRRA